jgi:hypothetical protein
MGGLFGGLNKDKKKEAERKALKKKINREMLQEKIKELEERMRAKEPIAFKMPVAVQTIEEPYMALIERQKFVETKLEKLKDVRISRWYEPVLYFMLEIFMGIFVIYTLLYRVMGEEYFSEVTMTFGLDIDPLYISLGFEALVIVMFSIGMKLYMTSRFDETKKDIVVKIMKFSILLFIGAYGLFVYLSNI